MLEKDEKLKRINWLSFSFCGFVFCIILLGLYMLETGINESVVMALFGIVALKLIVFMQVVDLFQKEVDKKWKVRKSI